MEFTLTDEQSLLQQATRQLLSERFAAPRRRELLGSARQDPELWSSGCEMGWTALSIPEAQGGFGQGLVDSLFVAVELGAAGASGAFMDSVVVARALARARHPEASTIAEHLSSGAATAVVAQAADLVVTGMDQPRVSGTARFVHAAQDARWVLAGYENRTLLIDIGGGDASLDQQRTIDITRPHYRVRLADAAALVLEAPASRSLLEHQLLLAADSIGAARTLLQMTVDYVKVREQFGRLIGSFQAIKHKCASMQIAVHAATISVHYAAAAIDADLPDADLSAQIATAFACENAAEVAGEALQAHGGIGFTWEHDLHLLLRRIKTNEALVGTPDAIYECIGRQLVQR